MMRTEEPSYAYWQCVDNPANLFEKDSRGWTALHWARIVRREECTRLLEEAIQAHAVAQQGEAEPGSCQEVLERIFDAEGLNKPWALDTVAFDGGISIKDLLNWLVLQDHTEEEIHEAAARSPRLTSRFSPIMQKLVLMPGNGTLGDYGEVESACVDGY